MSVLIEMTDDELCGAGGRLQTAHDYIELHGFDIDAYNPCEGACCYIGSTKVCAGESGGPRRRIVGGAGEAAALALGVLDEITPRTYKDRSEDYPGSSAEQWGVRALKGRGTQEQAEKALPVFRNAIREVRAEMDRRA